MTNPVSPPAEAPFLAKPLDLVSPAATRMLFLRARHLAESSSLVHVPFLFWLVEAARPQTHMALGVGDAVAYFAVCQAMERIDFGARSIGVDPRPGDAGGIAPAALQHNETQYADMSRLSGADLSEAIDQVRDGEVDLLSVEAGLDDTGMDQLLEAWKPKLSPRAVILIHGSSLDEESVLAQQYPVVSLEGEETLLVVLHGSECDDRLRGLAALAAGTGDFNEVRRVFERLGRGQWLEWRHRCEQERVVELEAALAATRSNLNSAEARADKVQQDLAELEKAYDNRSRLTAETQAQLFDLQNREREEVNRLYERCVELERAVETSREEAAQSTKALELALQDRDQKIAEAAQNTKALELALQDRDQKIAKAKQSMEAIELDLKERDRKIADATQSLDAIKSDHLVQLSQRDQRIAELAREVEAVHTAKQVQDDARIASLEASLQERFQEIATLITHLEAVEEDRQALATHRDALIHSTSWRVTAPVRRLSRGKGAAAPAKKK